MVSLLRTGSGFAPLRGLEARVTIFGKVLEDVEDRYGLAQLNALLKLLPPQVTATGALVDANVTYDGKISAFDKGFKIDDKFTLSDATPVDTSNAPLPPANGASTLKSRACTFSMIAVSAFPVFSKTSTQSAAPSSGIRVTCQVTANPLRGSIHRVLATSRRPGCFARPSPRTSSIAAVPATLRVSTRSIVARSSLAR